MQYRDADTIHLVLANLNIHCLKSLTDAFGSEMGCEVWGRFTIHFTPKHGSWLNQAEIENASGDAGSQIWVPFAVKPRHGTVE